MLKNQIWVFFLKKLLEHSSVADVNHEKEIEANLGYLSRYIQEG
jgi:hypothetical protein